jgi:hypothetical protein
MKAGFGGETVLPEPPNVCLGLSCWSIARVRDLEGPVFAVNDSGVSASTNVFYDCPGARFRSSVREPSAAWRLRSTRPSASPAMRACGGCPSWFDGVSVDGCHGNRGQATLSMGIRHVAPPDELSGERSCGMFTYMFDSAECSLHTGPSRMTLALGSHSQGEMGHSSITGSTRAGALETSRRRTWGS